MTQEVLLLGGPADGRRTRVDDTRRPIEVAIEKPWTGVLAPHEEDNFDIERAVYWPSIIQIPDEQVIVYTYSHPWPLIAVLTKLIDGYRKENWR